MRIFVFKKIFFVGAFTLALSHPSIFLVGDEYVENNDNDQFLNQSDTDKNGYGASVYYGGDYPYEDNGAYYPGEEDYYTNEYLPEEEMYDEEYPPPSQYPADEDVGVYYYGGVPYRWDGNRWVQWNNRSPLGRTVIRREATDRREQEAASMNRQNFRGQVRDSRPNGGVRSAGNIRNRGSRR
jgi:hypothetical protein